MRRVLMSFLCLFLLGACIQQTEKSEIGAECGEDGNVCLILKESDSYQTKVFGDNLATTAEKKVKSAKIFIFKSGNKLFEKVLNNAEILQVGSSGVNFTVPGLEPSTSYDGYVIINHGDIAASSVSDLKNIDENDVASYNGAWNQVFDAATDPNRTGGFVMVGNAMLTTTATLSDPQSLAVTARRITAKLDVTTNIDPTVFGNSPTNKYQGTVAIDSVKVLKTQATTPLILATPKITPGTLTLAKQNPNVFAPNQTYQNRFYVFENGPLDPGNQVLLNIYATYTNGSVTTPVVYPVELTTDGTGTIVRNGAYAINITIKGLTGANISVTITLSNWETVVTQGSNIGT